MKAVKIVIAVVALAAAAWFGKGQLEQRALIEKQNEAVELHNAGKYQEAVTIYEDILPRLSPEHVASAKKNLAKCYKAIGDNPGLSLKKQISYYKLAMKYDPSCVTDPNILKMVQKEKAGE